MRYFLKIDGIGGDSSTLPYLHWIEASSFDCELTSMSVSAARAVSTAKAHGGIVYFTANVDSSFPKLRFALISGKPIASAKFAGTSSSSLLQGTFTDFVISSLQLIDGSARSPRMKFSLRCNKINIEHGHVVAARIKRP